MSEIENLRSTQTLVMNNNGDSCTLHLLELELPDRKRNPSMCIAHIGVKADVAIENIHDDLGDLVVFSFLYTPNLRQRRIQEGQEWAEASVIGDFIFLDRYKPETIVNGQRYLAGMVAVNESDFTDVKGEDYCLPDGNLNPYDFYISAIGTDKRVRLGLE